MSETAIKTPACDLKKVLATNYTTNGYPTRIPTVTEPSGDGIIELAGGDGKHGMNGFIIVPIGVGSNNNTFNMRMLGWRRLGTDPNTRLWIPVTLFEVQCTLTTSQTGVAGKVLVAADLFADTIAEVTGNDGVNYDIVSPADNTIAHLLGDGKGFRKLEPIFTTGGVATSCNALFATL